MEKGSLDVPHTLRKPVFVAVGQAEKPLHALKAAILYLNIVNNVEPNCQKPQFKRYSQQIYQCKHVQYLQTPVFALFVNNS